jgi:hypothetical protein
MFEKTPGNSFLVAKNKIMLEQHLAMTSISKNQNIFELGIFRGGSTAWLNESLQPKKLIAIDYKDNPVSPLENYIDKKNLRNVIKTYYSIDQKNIEQLNDIYQQEFGDQHLDLVIDDASHLLDESSKSFNFLFPRLRTGGTFILEDWAWAHTTAIEDSRVATHFSGKPPLSTLLMEIIMASASHPGLIDSININSDSAYITRGPAMLDVGSFDISKSYKIHQPYRLNDGLFLSD